MHCTVLRPINGPQGMIAAGQVVDTAAWRKRNRDVLIARKYLREEPTYALMHPETPDDESEPEKTSGKKAR